MSNIIGIINYGLAGNIHSINNALKKAGGSVKIVNTKEELNSVNKIIIPGVGSFQDAMNELKSSDLLDALQEFIATKPTLGICLGMQILASLGFEYGKTKGLSVINAEVKLMQVDEKIPHMGFNTIDVLKNNKLLNGLENEEFYFMHSYEMLNTEDIATSTTYAGYSFTSAIKKNNIYGVQFHPEKSREAGIKLFRNFINL